MNLLSLVNGDIVDKGMDLIDKAFYTDAEKAAEKSKLLETMTPFKRAQRWLASRIFSMFEVLFYLELVFAIVGAWYPLFWELIAVINELTVIQMLCYSFLAVVSLYFTGGVIGSFKK